MVCGYVFDVYEWYLGTCLFSLFIYHDFKINISIHTTCLFHLTAAVYFIIIQMLYKHLPSDKYLVASNSPRWQCCDACHHTYTLWIEWDVFCEFTSVVYRDRGEKHTKRPHIQLFRINTNTSSEERSVLKSSPLLWIIHLSDFCLFNIVS